MVVLTVNGQKMNGGVVVFYVFPKYRKDIFIKGIMDWDLYEETDCCVKFIDANGDFVNEIPPNPYEKYSLDWKAYKDASTSFKVTKDFIQLLSECVDLEHHYYEDYDLEIEALYW